MVDGTLAPGQTGDGTLSVEFRQGPRRKLSASESRNKSTTTDERYLKRHYFTTKEGLSKTLYSLCFDSDKGRCPNTEPKYDSNKDQNLP